MDTAEPPIAEISSQGPPADSALPGLLRHAPSLMQPYLSLARIDRPVGIWLLFIPCLMGLFYARIPTGFHAIDLLWIFAFLIGAIAMRGAGCTWNDITDRDIDASVSRTAARPLPSAQIDLWQAYAFLAAQLGIGFLIWLTLPVDAKLIALLALPLVGAYPFMKRLTWWPQAWLGLTFNWGVLVGAATASHISFVVLILYVGLVMWTIAYDTVYAMQDVEDDALIGVKSTARLFGSHTILAVFCFLMAAAALFALAANMRHASRIGALAALIFIGHAIWQVSALKSSRGKAALGVFKSNVGAGAILATGLALAALIPQPQPRSLYADHEIVPLREASIWEPASWPIKHPKRQTRPQRPPVTHALPIWTKAGNGGDIWMLTPAQRLANEQITGTDRDAGPDAGEE